SPPQRSVPQTGPRNPTAGAPAGDAGEAPRQLFTRDPVRALFGNARLRCEARLPAAAPIVGRGRVARAGLLPGAPFGRRRAALCVPAHAGLPGAVVLSGLLSLPRTPIATRAIPARP